MSIDVVIEDPRWADLGIEALAEAAIGATLGHVGLRPEDWEVALLACGDTRITALNTDFRDKPTATNVLSWPSEDRTPDIAPSGDRELGDIAIAYETCLREAEVAKIPLKNHTTHLLVHGTLHLLGYDHEQDADADLMEATEIAILASLGVPDPYSG